MTTHPNSSTAHDRLDRIRAIIEVAGVATLTITQLVSVATAVTAASRRRRTTCR
jgi:hypothetical protein